MSSLTPAQIAAAATRAGFTGSNVPIATAVALAESGGNPLATHQNTDTHKSVDYGLFQINSYWNASVLSSGDWKDPQQNAQMAYTIWKSAGWGDWVTYKTGAYLSHMSTANTAAATSTSDSVSAQYQAFTAQHSGTPGVIDAAGSALSALTWIMDLGNMVRVLEVLGGTLLLLFGLHGLATDGSLSQTIQVATDKGKAAHQAVKSAVTPKSVIPPTPPIEVLP